MFPDKGIGEIKQACEECGYVMLVTADHGNAERMIDENDKPVTKHTTFKGKNGVRCQCVCVVSFSWGNSEQDTNIYFVV